MNGRSYVVSYPERESAMRYMSVCVQNSVLMQQLPGDIIETGDFTLVTASASPSGGDFFYDWCIPSCVEWLIAEIRSYVAVSQYRVVALEDIVSSPSDSMFSTSGLPTYWRIDERIVWPVTQSVISQRPVEQVLAWSVGGRLIAVFSSLSEDGPNALDTRTLSRSEVQELATAISRVVVDVFDYGGFMIWDRNVTQRQVV